MKTKSLSALAGALLAAMSVYVAAADERKPAPPPRPETAAAQARHSGPLPGTQQYKMKRCNEEASKKELRGDARKSFMSACLKG